MHKQRWLQIEGNSGVGKSSLVLSELLPAIEAGWLAMGLAGIGALRLCGQEKIPAKIWP
jgi:hypothetical protein